VAQGRTIDDLAAGVASLCVAPDGAHTGARRSATTQSRLLPRKTIELAPRRVPRRAQVDCIDKFD
jgi:hypothetical protein